MTSARRILDAVTLRRVFAALLIGGFSNEIISFLSWLADTGWDLTDVATLRALVLATLQFALEAAVIYLAVRGLSAVLDRWRRERALAFGQAESEEYDPADGLGEFEATGADSEGSPREGSGDGRGPEHY